MNRFFSVLVFLVLNGLAANAGETTAESQIAPVPGSTHKMTLKALLDKMEKATDPYGKAKSWKSTLTRTEMTVPMQQLKLAVNILCKYPDKSKLVMTMPGIPKITEVCNGKRAWKETAGLGIQEKTGIQLDFAKFQCRKNNPAIKLTELYAKVTLDPQLYQLDGFTCYKLICELPPEFKIAPTRMFIDTKEFLPRCAIENQLTDMGIIPVKMDFSAFRSLAGIKMPTKVSSTMMGLQMHVTVLSFEVNCEAADSEFRFPGNN
ncbi:MAG: hypothetical protein PHV59_10380 [Victivallales bacterium]|nr:hypothetical protein [Victivallales bacterium]